MGRLRAQVGARGAVLEAGDAASLERALDVVLDAGAPADVLAINGGDGTVHVVLTALMRRAPAGWIPPLVQVLPGGTMNTVARSYGVSGRLLGVIGRSPEAWLARLLAYPRADAVPAVQRHLLRVSDGAGADQYGFLFGNGVITNFLEAYYAGSEATPGKALRILAQGVGSAFVGGATIRQLMRPARVSVAADGADWPYDAYLCVAAGTCDDVGFGFRPFFEAPRQAGSLHALGIACTALQFVLQLPRVWLARPLTAPRVVQGPARALRLRGQDGQVYMIDGDFHRAGPELTVEVGPALRLGVPGRAA